LTTILWSKAHNEVAADRQLGSIKLDGGKLFHVPGGILTGAGYYDEILEVVDWFQVLAVDVADGKEVQTGSGKESDFLYVDMETGDAYFLTYPFLRRVKIKEQFFALGTGGQFAVGALAAGATPAEAMRIAHKYDVFTGSTFDIIQVGNNGTSGRKKTVRAKSS